MRRVVVTGAGAVSALGLSAQATMRAMAEGVNGVSQLAFADVERLSIQIGGQVHDWDAAALFEKGKLALYDRFTQFALKAAEEAMAQSGLVLTDEMRLRAGCIIGTAGGGNSTVNDSFKTVFEEGKNRVHPFVVPKLMNNAACSHICMEQGLMGPSFSVATACASSNHAIGLAFQMVRAGMADVMLAGGAESMLNLGGLKAWEGLRVMSKDACRPFSLGRNGMVQGEGAGVFVLEDYESAKARGAEILCEIKGFAMSSDAGDIVMPSVIGAGRAISGALADAGLAPDQIGYINAHGTGTSANDKTEAAAIHAVFGAAADTVMVSSTKAMHGHCIGGTGAIEMLACLLALNEGVIAPTINFEAADPDCALDVVPNTAREAKLDAVLSNAFAFGGLNAVLALGRV